MTILYLQRTKVINVRDAERCSPISTTERSTSNTPGVSIRETESFRVTCAPGEPIPAGIPLETEKCFAFIARLRQTKQRYLQLSRITFEIMSSYESNTAEYQR